jgi:predicted lipoprotein
VVLHDLVQHVVLPDVQTIVRETRTLERDLHELVRNADAHAVATARASLRRAMLAWQRAQAFRDGPMLETHALIRSTFWPIRRPAIAQLVRAHAHVAELGVDVKGVFALEHLLFEGPELGTHWLSGDHMPAALTYAHALASELCEQAERALQAFESGLFAEQFAEGGQTSLNRLINHMLASLETLAADRLGRVLARGANVQDIPGGSSAVATDLTLSWLSAIQSLFLGQNDRGIAALVKLAAPAIEPGARAAFERAVRELSRVSKRLEQAEPSTLESAARALKDLEVLTKVELVAALGVNLSFISTDGD